MRRKSRFLTAFFSLMPGAGHMYLGLLNKGISIMLAFCFGVYISTLYFIGPIGLFVIVPVFFYSFFDALDLGEKMAMGVNIEDSDGIFDVLSISRKFFQNNEQEYDEYKRNLNKKAYSIIGIVFILIGFFGVVNVISSSSIWLSEFVRNVKQYIIPLGFVVLGIVMLRKK